MVPPPSGLRKCVNGLFWLRECVKIEKKLRECVNMPYFFAWTREFSLFTQICAIFPIFDNSPDFSEHFPDFPKIEFAWISRKLAWMREFQKNFTWMREFWVRWVGRGLDNGASSVLARFISLNIGVLKSFLIRLLTSFKKVDELRFM